MLKFEFKDELDYVGHRRRQGKWLFDKEDWKKEYIGVSTESSQHSDIQIGLLLANHIENFGNTQAKDRYQSPLDLFEITIVQVLSRINSYMTSSKLGIPRIKEERELMQDISKIRSELGIIGGILSQQKQILNSFIESVNPDRKEFDDWSNN